MPRRQRSRRWRWIGGILLLLIVAAAVGIRIVIVRAQPILRARVIDTLAARFKSRVELAELHVWVANGLHVDGKGLQIYGATDPNPWEAGVQPLFQIGEFRFQTALGNLFRDPMNVDTIYLSGLTMNIPPKGDRKQMGNFRKRGGKMSITVDHFVCEDTKLIINTNKPGKAPLVFDISDLRMKELGPGQPLRFDATLVNPKPVGNIKSTGSFGPLNEESPRDSAVVGDYSFTQADLGTIKGIGGILSSTGKYAGTLGRIEVEGQTDTPDFQVAVSGHRVPLHTDFHAIVDGTDGDTYLEPVKARVLHSSFTASGKIVRLKDPQHGHDIELDVVLDHATIEDLLKLGVKTDPPIMTGAVAMKTKLSLQPGPADVANRLKLVGGFHIPEGFFTNEKLQGRIDSLSMRSLGKHTDQNDQAMPSVRSDLQGKFTLNQGVLSFSLLHFQIPGTHADMTGDYSLDGNTFDFHGLLRLDAKLSQMTTGWKSILLKPVDPFFQKHGAGAEVPFKVTGTRSEPHFGLDFHHKEEHSPKSQGEAGASR
jgi:AsmA-like protein